MWRRTLVALRKAAPAAAVAAAAAATIATQSTPCQAAGVQSAVQVPVPKPRSKDAYKGYDYSRLTFVDGKSPAMRGDMEEFILNLQDEICGAIEAEDGSKFKEDQWIRPGEGGGGRSRVLQDSKHFEKAGVNVSVVHGKLPLPAVRQMKSRGREIFGENPPFYACGISLVMHPRNPHAPTVHANFRFFEVVSTHPETGKEHTEWWFGGGADLTPNYLYEEDAVHFHSAMKAGCDAGGKDDFYPRFKAWCDKYFFIKHRDECRGVGGVFFDDMDSSEGTQEDMFNFVKTVGSHFVPAYLPILKKRMGSAYTEDEVAWKRLRGGRYTEFNLVHDRGTKFGLATPGARIESILMSLPLHADWKYCHEPTEESREGKLMKVLRNPRDWLQMEGPEQSVGDGAASGSR